MSRSRSEPEDAARDAPRGRALITFSRSWHALAAVRSLGRRGVEVLAGDEYKTTPGALSKYSAGSFEYPNPNSDPEGFLDALEEAVKRHAPPPGTPYVLMPVHREAYLVARHRERFEPHVKLALPPTELIETVRDKGRLAELAREHGVPVPRTWAPRDRDELERLSDHIELPAYVKIRTGAAGVGLRCVETPEELIEAFDELVEKHCADGGDPPIVQRAAEGDDYCATALLDHGEPRALLVYRNVRTFLDGGPGVIRETVVAPPVERMTEKLLSALGWHGIAQVDFLWDGDEASEPVLVEINPRFFGGLYQAIASGVDYPWMLYRLALGLEVEPPDEIDVEVRTETPLLGVLSTLHELADSAVDLEPLERAWNLARRDFDHGSKWRGLRTMLLGLRKTVDHKDRARAIREILQESEGSLSMLIDSDDPQAGLGLLYVLTLWIRHGKITPDLLVGAEEPEPEA